MNEATRVSSYIWRYIITVSCLSIKCVYFTIIFLSSWLIKIHLYLISINWWLIQRINVQCRPTSLIQKMLKQQKKFHIALTFNRSVYLIKMHSSRDSTVMCAFIKSDLQKIFYCFTLLLPVFPTYHVTLRHELYY